MIDRQALVRRHNPRVTGFDRYASLSVGNGNYAFTVDATGLQTFPELYRDGGVQLGNMANWAWHTFPNPERYSTDTFAHTTYTTFNGRSIAFPYMPAGELTEEYKWLRFNPHKLHLGVVGFRLDLPSGEPAGPEHIGGIEQTLDLWTGAIESRFVLNGEATQVETRCHPELDMIAVRVRSGLIRSRRLRVAFRFPYGNWEASAVDWNKPEAHRTEAIVLSGNAVRFERELDDTRYRMTAAWSGGELARDPAEPHAFVLTPSSDDDTFELRFRYTAAADADGESLPDFAAVQVAGERHWERFWRGGAAVELTGSKDSRAPELERRIVLSQYLTAIQSSGELPPQETGLTQNSWAGKFHLEMHWWHAVHFALWNRPELLENSLGWYRGILGKAEAVAAAQGYEGARWPKCVGPDGVNAPCYIEPFLIWQQPHPIYYAELIYSIRGDAATLERYRDIVFATATFMASFAEWDEAGGRYVLGPPVAPAQEIYDHGVTMNPTFELSYWAFGLSTANAWRERLGLPRQAKWDHVVRHLSALPVQDGVYVAAETAPDTFRGESGITDHPTLLAPLGLLPGHLADAEMMRRTLRKVMDVWNWDKTWGWDYPMIAMTAARLGETEIAIDALLMEKQTNTYLPNGHNYQRKPLPLYLPGNGGLLTAVAMMAGGWTNGPATHAPGFPQDGSWNVRCEGVVPML